MARHTWNAYLVTVSVHAEDLPVDGETNVKLGLGDVHRMSDN